MIDQDYAELLGRSPPTGDLLEWTFPARSLSTAFVSLLIGTPALCLAMFMFGGEADDVRGNIDFRVPTLTQLSTRTSPVGDVFTAGMHVAAIMAIPLFWCVKLSHHQRLQARTGVARYDLQAEHAIRWVTAAWIVGTLGAAFTFATASVPGDERGVFSSAQGVAHLVLSLLAAGGMIGQAACTAWALTKARRVFVVSEADLVAYRQKIVLASLAVFSVFAALSSVLVVECFADGACGMKMEPRSGSSGSSSSSSSSTIISSVTSSIGHINGISIGSDLVGENVDRVSFFYSSGALSEDERIGVAETSFRAALLDEEGGGAEGGVDEETREGPDGRGATFSAATTTAVQSPDEGSKVEPIPGGHIRGEGGERDTGLPGEGGGDDVTGVSGHRRRRDCDEEWCYSRSLMGVWEWVLLLIEAGFCIALRHDLAPATGGVGVESFVL